MLFRAPSASTGGPRKQTLCQQLQPSYSLAASVCSAGFSARIGLFVIGSSVYLFPSVWTKMFCIQNFSLKLRWYFPRYIAESSKSVWWAFQIYRCMAFQTRLWLCPFCFCPGPEVMLRPGVSKMCFVHRAFCLSLAVVVHDELVSSPLANHCGLEVAAIYWTH